MLSGLFIQNIAVIERASIDFEAGLTVMTGETGAGKSIIIDAIGAILGERTSKDLIRTGCDTAAVTALFTGLGTDLRACLTAMNIPCEEDELHIYREIRASGKSLCKLGGVPVTVSMLREVGVKLIGIHGQHDSYELLSPELHGRYLDAYGMLGPLLSQYQVSYGRLREIKNELDRLNTDEAQKERRLDLLRYQIEEIEAAELFPGEREALARRRDLMRNSEAISHSVSAARDLLTGDEDRDGVISLLSTAAEYIERAAENLPELTVSAQKLRDMEYSLQDIGEEIRGTEDDIEFSPQELEEVEQRIDFLYRLSLKYGESEEEILEKLESFRQELSSIALSEERLGQLSAEFEQVKSEAIALARSLSEKRKECATDFSNKVKSELRFLNMAGTEFKMQLERCALYTMGCDKIQFMVSANAGEEAKPLSKIASGGELSRIMLAIKTVLAGGDRIPTMIFDEIDVGISGEAANKVGKKLKEVSKNRQVVCITHLAQIAAMADHHMRIEKQSSEGKTYTSVAALSREGRVQELARMIGGDGITPLKCKMAEEMLDKA